MLPHLRIVLVRTHSPSNLGSVARAMRNFGANDLVLVDPIAELTAYDARRSAVHAVDILDSARIVPTLPDAVGDCLAVLATDGDTEGRLRQTMVGAPDEILPSFVAAMSSGPVALVFGPEPHGLTNDEIAFCQGLLHLPTAEIDSSLNLSLSVGLCLYEIHRRTHTSTELQRPPAPFADFERAIQHLEAAFGRVSYLHSQNGAALMTAFRHLLARSQPTPVEVGMLHGLADQLEYIAARIH